MNKQHLTEYLVENGTRLQDAKKMLQNKTDDEVVHLGNCLKTSYSFLVDLKLFIANFKSLLQKPYHRCLFGEKTETALNVRDNILQQIEHESSQEFAKKQRVHFAVWLYWQQNKSKIYVTLPLICAWAHKVDINVDDMFLYLKRHPKFPNLYTYSVYSDYENSIMSMVQNAEPSFYKSFMFESVLDATQKQHIKSIMTSGFSILQGGAGVGKTTTVSELINQVLCNDDVQIYCLAYTHKAKTCLQQKISIQDERLAISTIHSFLTTVEKLTCFPLPIFVLIDETSMIDLELMGQLAQVLNQKCFSNFQVLWVGDDQQLPPIGRGELFRHFVQSNFHVHNLTTCYRVDKPDLFNAYQQIRAGVLPSTSENVTVTTVPDDQSINSYIGKFIKSSFLPLKTQIIAWQNRDVFKINKWVQQTLLQRGSIGPDCFKGFYKNDLVVYVGENNETTTNALTGVVTAAHHGSMIIAWSTGKSVLYQSDPRDIQLAYCMTCHKLQGSEYDSVLVACFEVYKMKYCLDRRWFYTACTRAKQSLQIVTTGNLSSFLKEPIKPIPIMNLDL